MELTCYDGTRCHTPGGGIDGPATSPKIQRDALPLTNRLDQKNAQQLSPLDPSIGLPVDVDLGTQWRLYVVYIGDLNPDPAPVGNGKTLGMPGNGVPPDLVPAMATNGHAGWVKYRSLTDQASPTLTSDGTEQAPIPMYGADGTTVIGEADASRTYR